MLRKLSVICTVAICFHSAQIPTSGDEGNPVDPNTLSRFEIAKSGRALILPVKYAGRNLKFVVHTGIGVNAFDKGIDLGESIGTTTAKVGDEIKTIKVFAPPIATIGGLPLSNLEFVLSMDLSNIREIYGEQVDGIIGLDFLGRHIVRIDCDKGELLLLKQVPNNAGLQISIAHDSQLPHLPIRIAGSKDVIPMLINTVEVGFGSLDRKTFDVIASKGGAKVLRKNLVGTVGGMQALRCGRFQKLMMAEFQLENPVLSEYDLNTVGMTFLSQFVMTIDFPNKCVYVVKGTRFGEQSPLNRSGLNLIRKNGIVAAFSVDLGSPSDEAGLKVADRILIIDGRRCDSTDLFTLRSLLCKDGQIEIQASRGGESITTKLRLSK